MSEIIKKRKQFTMKYKTEIDNQRTISDLDLIIESEFMFSSSAINARKFPFIINSNKLQNETFTK